MSEYKKKKTISALVLTYNEEDMIGACLDTLGWCDQIVVIDSGSTDKTVEIAESKGAKIISFSHPSFSRRREEALKRSDSEWVFYVDADERVTPTLAKEIEVHIETSASNVFAVGRENYYFGHSMQHGGWEADFVERVFKREALEGWFGDVHESPKYTGSVTTLNTRLIHLTHRSVVSGLFKTARWTPFEAQALFESGVKSVTFLTVLRKGLFEFVRRAIQKKGYKDGEVGLIESLIQALNRVLVYLQVWELQQKPPINDVYKRIELDVAKQWDEQK